MDPGRTGRVGRRERAGTLPRIRSGGQAFRFAKSAWPGDGAGLLLRPLEEEVGDDGDVLVAAPALDRLREQPPHGLVDRHLRADLGRRLLREALVLLG